MDTVYIHVRIPKELKNKLMKQAKEQNITLNAYLNLMLRKR